MRNVVKRAMVVLMALCILLAMTPVSTQAATKTVTYNAYKTKTNDLVILLKNNTKNDMGVETTVKFYDKAGKEVGKVTDQVYVVYGKCEYVQEIYAPVTESNDTIPYSKYKVSVKAIKAEHSGVNTSKIIGKAGSYDKQYKGVEVDVKNNSNVACNVNFIALFFKDKKFTAAMPGGTDTIQPKGTGESYIYDSYDDGTKIKYDSIKIVINDASAYDENQEGY